MSVLLYAPHGTNCFVVGSLRTVNCSLWPNYWGQVLCRYDVYFSLHSYVHRTRRWRRKSRSRKVLNPLPTHRSPRTHSQHLYNRERTKKRKIRLNRSPMELVFTGRISRETSCMIRRPSSRVPFTLIVRTRNGGFSLAQPQGL